MTSRKTLGSDTSASNKQSEQDLEINIKQTIDIGIEIEEVKKEIEKELHQKRLEDLKKLLVEIESDNWKYQSGSELSTVLKE